MAPISLTEFLMLVQQSPVLLITVVLTLGVILVNGWTDAPNAIATCVSTRAISAGGAVLMAAVFNFLGVWFMTAVNVSVAQTIYTMVDFSGDSVMALAALCAAMTSIVVWAVAAWYCGIPTSESHALIAGISGAAIALQGGFSAINTDQWVKVLYGLVLSLLLGFFLGFLVVKTVVFLCRNVHRRKANRLFNRAQVAGGAAMAFMHGAQDGQKFMGVFLLGLFLSQGRGQEEVFAVPFWLILLCSVVMALGTSIGGRRIIKAVGMDMVKLESYQGFSADAAAAISLLFSSLSGIPVSTTHTKTAAVMGVGTAGNPSKVKWSVVLEMVAAWLFTFPGCGIIGYGTATLFMEVFTHVS